MKIAITFLMTFLFFFCSGQEKRKACLTSADTIKGQKIYTQNDLLDSLPRFGNNISDFHNCLRKNFGSTYKKDADNSIYKIVYSFIIDTDGKLIHPCILNNLDNPNYDRLQADFAMALEKCPKWRCGYKDTAKVVTRMTYEMDIKLGY